MQRIYDDEGTLLHVIVRREELYDQVRLNVCDDDESLQIAALCLYEDQSFPAHKHLEQDRHVDMPTQETWIVIQGMVKIEYFDTKGKSLATAHLKAGDCTVTFEGGHKYTSLADETLVYEVKNGPYNGQELDKELLWFENG